MFPYIFGNILRLSASHLRISMKIQSCKILIVAVAAVLRLAAPHSSLGATANVTVNNAISGGFVPAVTNINVGDTVVWT